MLESLKKGRHSGHNEIKKTIERVWCSAIVHGKLILELTVHEFKQLVNDSLEESPMGS